MSVATLLGVFLALQTNAALAKVGWSETSKIETIKDVDVARPEGFRLIGDRAGTFWVSVDGKSDLYFTRPPADKITANHVAIIETLQKMGPTAPLPDETLVMLELEPASFVSRKAVTGHVQQNALISWPILLTSALVGLLLWGAERRAKIS